MEIPILKKNQHKHKTTFNSFVTTLYLKLEAAFLHDWTANSTSFINNIFI